MEGMSREAIWQMVQQLQAGLCAREKQLERQGQQLASMQEVQHQLQVTLMFPCQLPLWWFWSLAACLQAFTCMCWHHVSIDIADSGICFLL